MAKAQGGSTYSVEFPLDVTMVSFSSMLPQCNVLSNRPKSLKQEKKI